MSQNLPEHLSEYEVRLLKEKELRKIESSLWGTAIKPSMKIKDAKFLNEEDYSKFISFAGRIIGKREHGKSIFITIRDSSDVIQCYIKNEENISDSFNNLKNLYDIGDYIFVSGSLFKTKTNELTLRINEIKILSKCLHPIPDSHTGLNDIEIKYRQRYLDMLVYEETKNKFIKRSLIIQKIREFLNSNNFLEVETPMLHPIPGGASAKPFITKHNALDTNLFLRIAPELYLKKLVVGGLERVYEINRNFRNEGLSVRHNPEFTMLEFYMAHENYEFAMSFVEELIRFVLLEVNKSLKVNFNGIEIDFSEKFLRMNAKECLVKFTDFTEDEISEKNIDNLFEKYKLDKNNLNYNRKIFTLFEEFAEKKITNPVFLIDFPIEISPLAKRDIKNPNIASRFELFIAGMEISNGFNELNDPFDQAERFKAQALEKENGDEEAMHYDSDFIKSLEYGLPPTAGVGIGIDRLVMIATNSKSIKDVILFPTLKKIE